MRTFGPLWTLTEVPPANVGGAGNFHVGSGNSRKGGFFKPARVNLFWVGGTGNWSDKTHWAAKTGGTGGAGLPNSGVNVTFDANSGAAATVTIDIAGLAKNVTITKTDITILDNSGMTVTGTVTLNAGTLNTNGQTETWGVFSAPLTTARTLTITNSTINLTAGPSTSFIISSTTNLTTNVTGSTINLLGFSAGFAGQNAVTYPNVNFLGAGAMAIFSGSFVNVTCIGNSSTLFDNGLGIGTTLTVTGTMTVTGFSQGNRVTVVSNNAAGSTITAAAVALTNVEIRQITGAGAATWSGSTVGDLGSNVGITFTPAVTLYWIGNSGSWSDPTHWSLASGGATANLVPQAQDTARFDANSFTTTGQSLTMDYSEYSTMDWTGVLNTPNMYLFEGGNFCGDVTLSPNMTTSLLVNFFNRMTWYKAGATGTITTNGVGFAAGLSVNSPGGTFKLGDNFVQTGGIQSQSGLLMITGTFDANNKNYTVTAPVQSFSSATKAILMGSGTWTLAVPTGTIWTPSSTGFTLTAGTSTIKILGAPTGTRTFAGGGLTYNNIEWAAENSPSTLIITGANIFNDFKVDADIMPRTLTLPASTTTTCTTIELAGTAGRLLNVNSSTARTKGTLSQAAGTVTATFLQLQDSAATGGATFTATSSIDNGDNSGWTITP